MAKETMKQHQTAKTGDLHEEIRKLAGENYKTRIEEKKSGDAFSDWLQAEKEVNKKHML
jgi:phosphoribosylaminoimidazole (AIR) synthetase